MKFGSPNEFCASKVNFFHEKVFFNKDNDGDRFVIIATFYSGWFCNVVLENNIE